MRMPVYIGILNLHQCSRNPSYFHRIISAGILQVNQAGIRILLLRAYRNDIFMQFILTANNKNELFKK